MAKVAAEEGQGEDGPSCSLKAQLRAWRWSDLWVVADAVSRRDLGCDSEHGCLGTASPWSKTLGVRASEPSCGVWAELRGPAARGNCNSHPRDEGKEGQQGLRDSNVLKRQRQTYMCPMGELGTEGPLLVKLGVLMGFTCLRNLPCSGDFSFTLGLGFS